jgi:hypothetical protein
MALCDQTQRQRGPEGACAYDANTHGSDWLGAPALATGGLRPKMRCDVRRSGQASYRELHRPAPLLFAHPPTCAPAHEENRAITDHIVMNRVHRPDFDLNLLKVFDAIMETRSASQAAVALGTSQSAVSHCVGSPA